MDFDADWGRTKVSPKIQEFFCDLGILTPIADLSGQIIASFYRRLVTPKWWWKVSIREFPFIPWRSRFRKGLLICPATYGWMALEPSFVGGVRKGLESLWDSNPNLCFKSTFFFSQNLGSVYSTHTKTYIISLYAYIIYLQKRKIYIHIYIYTYKYILDNYAPCKYESVVFRVVGQLPSTRPLLVAYKFLLILPSRNPKILLMEEIWLTTWHGA